MAGERIGGFPRPACQGLDRGGKTLQAWRMPVWDPITPRPGIGNLGLPSAFVIHMAGVRPPLQILREVSEMIGVAHLVHCSDKCHFPFLLVTTSLLLSGESGSYPTHTHSTGPLRIASASGLFFCPSQQHKVDQYLLKWKISSVYLKVRKARCMDFPGGPVV